MRKVGFLALVLGSLVLRVSTDEHEVCMYQADLCFVVDSSGSINDRHPQNWDLVKNFMVDIVGYTTIGLEQTRVGVVRFSNYGTLEFPLNQYGTRQQVQDAIIRLNYAGGNTNTSGGLLVMRTECFRTNNGDRANVANTAIVITDGRSTVDTQFTIQYANAAKQDGIRIIAVGVTDQINMTELVALASPSYGDIQTVFTADEFNDLAQVLQKMLSYICVPVTTTTTMSTTPALRPPQECRDQVDLVFVLDASGSVESSNFNLMKRFVQDFVEDISVDTGDVRVGLMTFSSNVQAQLYLNTYTNRRDIIQAIDGVQYSRGTTDTGAALAYLLTGMYLPNRGDRPSARNVVLLITDGQSNDNRRTLEQARMVKDQGIHILVAGVGNWLDEEELIAIASYPEDSSLFRLDNFVDLNDDFRRRLRDLVCNNYAGCMSNPCRQAISCDEEPGFYSCTCSQGWGGQNCDQRCSQPVDVVVAMDMSGSVGKQNFHLMTEFVRGLIEGLRIGHENTLRNSRVGALTFASSASLFFHLNEYSTKYDLLNAFPPHYTGGTTNTADALRYIREQMFQSVRGDQSNVPNVAIIITDGRSDQEEDTWRQAMQTRARGIDLLVVGIGNNVRQTEMEGIASAPVDANVFHVQSFQNLDSVRQQVINALCWNDDVCTNNPCRNGGTCVPGLNGFTCECRRGYTGEFCERNCDGRVDLAFVIDASGSIHQERFPVVLGFVQSVVQNLEVSADRTRVAVITWSNEARVQFYFNTYTEKQDVIQALHYIRYEGQQTNTAAALNMMRTDLYSYARGDRDDVENYAIVITDGNSNINERNTIPAAVKARVDGIKMRVVAVGMSTNNLELFSIASEPTSQNVFHVERFQDLNNLISTLPQSICNDQNQCSSSPCQAGGTCMDEVRHYFCLCTEGRVGYDCQKSCRRQQDVVFMLDFSGSVEDQYDNMIRFTRQVVLGLDMTFDRTRFGVVTFGDSSTVQFDLNAYRDKQEVLNAIAFYPDRGQTNTQQALSRMHNELFSSGRGDRAGVDNVAILVTDGYSNINQHNTIAEARRAKNKGVAIYVIAIGNAVDMAEISGVAGRANEPPDDFVIRVQDGGQIISAADQLTEILCQ